jgi:outer membrane biosynthesis protein TonB
MMKFINIKQFLFALAGLVLTIALAASCGKKQGAGDHTLVLKNGTVLKGEMVGRTDTTFKFISSGETKEIPKEEVLSLTLKDGEDPVYVAAESPESPPKPEQQASPPPKQQTSQPKQAKQSTPKQTEPATAAKEEPAAKQESAPPPQPSPKPVTVPTGTKMMLKLASSISTQTHKAGSTINAVLETDLATGGVVVARKGTKVYGKVLESVGGKRIGGSKIVISFNSVSINNQLVAIATDAAGAEGGKGGTARKVGAGALIGAAAGGSSGAAKGAAVGGAVSLLGGGSHIQIPAGTLVEVGLTQPFTVEVMM